MKRTMGVVASVTVLATLAVSGCGTSTGNKNQNTSSSGAGNTANQATTNTSSSSSTGDKNKQITIGYMNWTEDVAATFLWKRLLEQKGYKVDLKQLSPGPVWEGLYGNQVNLFLDTWMPYADKHYMNKYGSHVNVLGRWYAGNTKEGFVVPDYMKNIKTVADLRTHAKEFGGKIVGISPGSIEMGQAKTAIQKYNLPYKLQSSSSAAMLTALKRAYDNKQPIVVTLWSPHWAFAKYHLHYIPDPKNVFGKPGVIETVATKTWSASHPTAISWLKNFHLSVKQLGTLEEDINNHPQDKMAGVDQWISKNKQLVDAWFK
ncbi:glycine betaine ABC transporter substrate-binding protein [Alicyclobacillus sp. SO9]|uniref:glycine betaine ABC transporter substrate-binding protein n=1 Tax=Alicyclobacillus sp. SO9 TaxID=2665646 RepID=UPI0018E8B39C|nr:glycine betaine ABC transporter substrate-binding protein [Alicyclobacillus sp. SO9]QQE78667.1 glycine betaine ABC transporter substrate-binding protein [Alicyclobacillus sp. SO9]